jgi:hypothetical protein
MCITYYLFTHTFVAPLGYIDIGELYCIFLKNVQNGFIGQKLNSIQYSHVKGELTLYVWIKMFIEYHL